MGKFKKNGDGTITDKSTGLMWQQKDDSNERSYENALSYCSSLKLGGFTDWRLPTAEELQTIVQPDGPANTDKTFVNAKPERYWTSTEYFSTREPNGKFAYTVDFQDGRPMTYYQEYEYYVRAVRG